jgi:hypothetical protein
VGFLKKKEINLTTQAMTDIFFLFQKKKKKKKKKSYSRVSNTAGHSYERVSWEGYSLSKWILLIKDKLTLVDFLFLWPQV